MAASAGGLEAYQQLLSHLPTDTGMAFVLISHLAPYTKSLLTEILARATQMPVHEVQDGMSIEPNCVYAIPPNTEMTVSNGVLQLSPRQMVAGKYMPGDAFFISLAIDYGRKAMAVVLSGMDGDGSVGLKAIKAAGGVTFAQCEGTAKFDSMPSRAVATGNVDFVLPPEQIATELARLSRNSLLQHPLLPLVTAEPIPTSALAQIFALLRAAVSVDFSQYKLKTVERRIQRRMLLYRLEQLEDYATYLAINPAEVLALYAEILIHVTSFFRDPEAFELLKTRVFPQITQTKSPQSPLRMWVPGCSTGEEVYSIAMCLLEFLGERTEGWQIQIFATDISDLAIDKARVGIYKDNHMVNVSPERRRRFFYQLDDGSYQIGKTVRDLCVFARQNLGADAPFSNLDLISCRNLLIYLDEPLQQRIMSIFHYSLNPTGFLLLGTAETTGKSSELFNVVDKQYRIYTKNPLATRPIFSFTTSTDLGAQPNDRPPLPPTSAKFDLEQQLARLIVDRYMPIGVVINSQMQVRQMRGDINLYLRLTSGAADLDILTLVRPDLQRELRAAIFQAQRQDVSVTKHVLTDESKIVHLEVIPFKVPNVEESYFLVLFEEVLSTNNAPVDPAIPQGDLEQEIARLRQERDTAITAQTRTHEFLRSIIQEHEYILQDLKVAHEEILASNEELQSTNEELETSKEELQATNEELLTTNSELRSRNSELFVLNNDTFNLLTNIDLAIVMLTTDLRVRRFTPMAQRLFNLISTDIQRPLSDLRTNLNIPDLEQEILRVQETLHVKAIEVQTTSGQWYMLTIRPYRTTENQIDGVVLVLHDIHAFKRSLNTIEDAWNYAEAIVESVPVPLLVLESDLRVNKANRAFYQNFQVEWQDTIQSSLLDLGNGQWNIPGLRPLLEGILTGDTTIQNVKMEQQFEQIGKKILLINAVKISDSRNTHRILLSIEDITERQ